MFINVRLCPGVQLVEGWYYGVFELSRSCTTVECVFRDCFVT